MKKLLLFVSLFISLSSFSLYKVGSGTVNLNNGHYIQTFVFYPATVDGNNAPIVDDGTKFPVVSFGHGFVMSPTAYNWLVNALVPYGYILAFPGTETGVPPNHSNFGKDEIYVARAIKALGDSSNSIFYRKTAEYNAIGGHSMGGGASYLGMQNVSDITTFFNFSAAETFLNESAITKAKVCRRPALVFTGSKDCIAPAAGNSLDMYKNLASEYKVFANILNGSHCQFADPNETPCELGEQLSCASNVYITRIQQQQRVMLLLKPWLDFWLKRDCNAITTFYDNAAANLGNIDTLQNKIITCSALSTITSVRENKNIKAQIYPNPSNGFLMLDLNENYKEITLNVIDLFGKMVDTKKFNNKASVQLDYTNLPKGMYQLQANTENGSYFSKFVIQ